MIVGAEAGVSKDSRQLVRRWRSTGRFLVEVQSDPMVDHGESERNELGYIEVHHIESGDKKEWARLSPSYRRRN